MTLREREAVQLVVELIDRALRRGLDDPAAEVLGLGARQLTAWIRGRVSVDEFTLHIDELISALARIPRGAPAVAFDVEHARILEGR